MFKFFFQLIVFSIFLNFSVHSDNYEKIIINGNERISNETILVFSEFPDSKSLNENSLNEILKRIYKSGFFENVSIKIENNNLIIDVTENPIIQTVFIEGIKRKKTIEDLYEILSLKNRSSFNSNLNKADEVKILNFLKNTGYYFSEISSSFIDLGNNKIDLFYNVDLGKKAKISKITFVGDKKFKDSTLRNVILSEEYKFWKLISGKKYLNENLISYDKRLIYNFYKNKGYYNSNVVSSFSNYLGDSEFELIYNINSGNKFFFNDITLKLPIDYDIENFEKLTKIFADLKGEKYSLISIDKILNEIDKIVLNKQYEFLNATVNETVNNDLINLTFVINESEKFYVEKINIFGNNITQEQVLRNVFLVDEGDAFNELLHKKTINSLKSLNFFSKVEDQIVDGKLKNQKIINITVDEKPTGEIMAGAGVGTDGGTVAFGVKENNFLGRGINFATDLSVGADSIKGIVSLNNPNYNNSNRSLNLSIENRTTDRLTNFGYKSNKSGFSIGSQFEYYDNLYLKYGTSTYIEKLTTDSTASSKIKKQEGNYFDTFLNYTFDYDIRNQKFQTTEGFRSRFTQNLPLISESYSLTNSYNFKLYNEWFDENIASFGFFASSTNSLTGKDVKLSDRLFISSNRLRGFESKKVGPKDGADYVGGNYSFSFNAATTLPQILPNFQSANFSLFFDAANVWGVDYDSSIDEDNKIRSAIGLAVDFFTPIGPLNFSLSEPITKGKNDITESFRFNLGTTF
jgi:outer membrane protein insertion porin family